MANHEELLHKYELANSREYKEIKSLVLDYLINLSTSTVHAERIQGALMAFKYVDNWVNEYNEALALRSEEN